MTEARYRFRLGVLLTGCCIALGCDGDANRDDYQPRPIPEVSSTELASTTIVPTLDTPLKKSGNAVWCATFQIAWNRARNDVIGEPLRIANAQDVANLLNDSLVTDAVLPVGSYVAVAGRLEDGINQTVQRKMAEHFPDVDVTAKRGTTGFLAYSYLETSVAFTTPFVRHKETG